MPSLPFPWQSITGECNLNATVDLPSHSQQPITSSASHSTVLTVNGILDQEMSCHWANQYSLNAREIHFANRSVGLLGRNIEAATVVFTKHRFATRHQSLYHCWGTPEYLTFTVALFCYLRKSVLWVIKLPPPRPAEAPLAFPAVDKAAKENVIWQCFFEGLGPYGVTFHCLAFFGDLLTLHRTLRLGRRNTWRSFPAHLPLNAVLWVAGPFQMPPVYSTSFLFIITSSSSLGVGIESLVVVRRWWWQVARLWLCPRETVLWFADWWCSWGGGRGVWIQLFIGQTELGLWNAYSGRNPFSGATGVYPNGGISIPFSISPFGALARQIFHFITG